MACVQETWLLVHVADRTEVCTDNLEAGVVPDIVLGHFEHA